MRRLIAFLSLLAVFPVFLLMNNVQANIQAQNIQISAQIDIGVTSACPDDIGMPANAAMDQQRTESVVATNVVNSLATLTAQDADSRTNSLATKCAALMVAESVNGQNFYVDNSAHRTDAWAFHHQSSGYNHGGTVCESGFGLKIPMNTGLADVPVMDKLIDDTEQHLVPAAAMANYCESTQTAHDMFFQGNMSQSAAQKMNDVSMAIRLNGHTRASPNGAGHRLVS